MNFWKHVILRGQSSWKIFINSKNIMHMEGQEERKEVEISTEKTTGYKEFFSKHRKGTLFFVGVILIVVVGIVGYFYQENWKMKNVDSVRKSTEEFIKKNMISPGTDLEIQDFKEEGGVYKMTLKVQKREINVYVTKDGKRLFPEVIDLEGGKGDSKNSSSGPTPVTEVSQKMDIPVVELFVMSYCPYGTQMEKGILPVVKTLGSKIKFDVKFVSYLMHGEKELKENINQYCIQKEEPGKFLGYLECFNKEGNSDKCAISTKINAGKIAMCVSETDKQFKLTEGFNASAQNGKYPSFNIHKELNDKYGVQGSPSLVINGESIQSGRDSASILKVVCSGFTSTPKECETALSSALPNPGFGDGTASAGGATPPSASCQ